MLQSDDLRTTAHIGCQPRANFTRSVQSLAVTHFDESLKSVNPADTVFMEALNVSGRFLSSPCCTGEGTIDSLREHFRHDVIELMMRQACAYQVSREGCREQPSIPSYLINTVTNTQPSWLLIGIFNKENDGACFDFRKS
jgi:hypothetical protein